MVIGQVNFEVGAKDDIVKDPELSCCTKLMGGGSYGWEWGWGIPYGLFTLATSLNPSYNHMGWAHSPLRYPGCNVQMACYPLKFF